ncbi:SusC/RagA family TonB-linked outer membrane protein [Aquimarina hainanensis]|uniref:SusC/RagA family TonB-linked outer membrane protein n=1 Tax=Aquimarina hainanensis TaxID=1578017 RepID=A0ABW5N7Q9_9FLAO
MKQVSKQVLMLFTALIVQLTFAQEKTVTGTITDNNSMPLPGVNILVKGTNTGTQSDFDGNYSITANKGAVLVYKYLGFSSKEIVIGDQPTIDVKLQESTNVLEEVVVTGVAQGTSIKKLGFDLTKVNVTGTQTIPTPDAASALIGKVSGAQIVRGSGNPLRNSAIILRGSSTIEGNVQPLIIVDGIITEGGLRDINSDDIQSIEVIKGAAASSLYGSLAGNGVIQIITKKGTSPEAQFTFKSEYGASSLVNEYPSATTHPFEVDSNGNFALDGNGNRIPASDGLFDNNFPQFFDNVNNLIGSQPYQSNAISVSQRLDKGNYYASFQDARVEGPIEGLQPFIRQSARFNADFNATEKFKLSINSSYVKTKGQETAQAGQGDNLFYSILVAEPFIDITERGADGQPSPRPTGYEIQGSNWQNPLYVANNQKQDRREQRFIGGVTGKYEILEGLSFTGALSLDRNSFKYNNFFPKGYETPTPNADTNNGFILIRNAFTERTNTSAQLDYSKSFNDFNLRASAKYLFENVKFEREDGSGSNFQTAGVGSLDQATENVNITSFSSLQKTQNYFLSVDVDWRDKLIIGGLIRTDRSSLFGRNNRDQVFYRGSIAYRLGEDIQAEWMDELKLRASYGTAGLRPSFGDIFETFDVSESSISLDQVGNPDLKSPEIREIELGLNLDFLSKYNFGFTYASSQTEGALITVPLSGAVPGENIKKNLGETEYQSLEFNLSGTPISTSDFTWNFGITGSKTTTEFTSLGGTPPFTRVLEATLYDAAPARDVFRVQAGLSQGAMFGNKIATSINDLTVENGLVVNDGLNLPIDDFSVNEFGHVVVTSNIGTENEQVVRVYDSETGQAKVDVIGDTNPDFIIGLSNTLTYKGLSLYFVLDWQQGGDVYNFTKQLLYFNDRHADAENFAAAGKHFNYFNAASNIYNRGQPIDYFVEDASFVKVREISLSYLLDQNILGKVGEYIDGMKFTLSGRNLFVFTDYSGWDPEVSIGTSPLFKFDEFSYPNFRTFVGSVQINF